MTDAPEHKDIYDPAYIKDLFDRCSDKYIAFSYVCSMGFTERWRRQSVELLNLPADRPLNGYDLMAGTGEVWPHLLKAAPNIETITAIDISSGMHRRALERLHQHRAHHISFIEDDALNSTLADESADFLISTFGLKTFNADQHKRLATLVARVLKPGGTFALVEASDPKGWPLRPLYLFHLKQVLPLVERIFLNGAQDFSMIGQYSTNFGNAGQFTEFLKAEGLDANMKELFFGCATAACGHKPAT